MNPAVQNLEACTDVRASFSAYLDGAVSGREMYDINAHLEDCAACKEEFASWREMQQVLAGLRAPKVPVDMGLKLRVAISQLKARQNSRWTDRLAIHWDNALRPLVIQASAGFAGAVVLMGGIMLLLGMVAAPQAVMAHDIPLGAMTVPHYLYSAASERPIVTDKDTTIVVEAAINAAGQVYDYRIVSGPESPEVERQVAEQLMLSVFEPARVFDSPVRGRVIVTFAGISVRG
jgi:anti-sigma factor RsiW